MGTVLRESPDDKIKKALDLINNRYEMIQYLEDEYLRIDYRALRGLLEFGLFYAEQARKMGIEQYTLPAFAPAVWAACIILGEDPDGIVIDKDGNVVG